MESLRRQFEILCTAGSALTLLGTRADSVGLAIAGTVVAGTGFGASGLATLGSIARLAGPADAAERGELFAVAYTVAYLAFSLPAMAAGYATTHVGLPVTVAAYSLLVIFMGLVTLAAQEINAIVFPRR